MNNTRFRDLSFLKNTFLHAQYFLRKFLVLYLNVLIFTRGLKIFENLKKIYYLEDLTFFYLYFQWLFIAFLIKILLFMIKWTFNYYISFNQVAYGRLRLVGNVKASISLHMSFLEFCWAEKRDVIRK